MERNEQEHNAIYEKADPLTPRDLALRVRVDGVAVTVEQLLRTLTHPDDVFKESAIKATPEGLVQLVYRKNQGSSLEEWPWA